MKHKILHTVFFLSSFFCHAQYNWQALPTAPISWRFDDIFFLNPRMGWAVNGDYNYLTPTQFGRIFRTLDGGNSWQLLKDSSVTFYRSVGFADSLTGWVGNLADTTKYNGIPVTTDTIPLYQTNDGGHTWQPANLPHPHPAGICGISVVTDSIVYAYGRYYGPAGYVKTVNKGATWTYTDMSAYASGLIDGYFFNKDTGFITGVSLNNTALILSTHDGGTTWQIAYQSAGQAQEYLWKLSFPSRDTGYASIQSFGGNTNFLKTTDGGISWQKKVFTTNFTYELQGIGFINNTTGWIGGDQYAPTYKTIDGGNTWHIDSSFGIQEPPYNNIYITGFSINRFRRFGDTLMYACGNTIYKLQAPSTGIKEVNKKLSTLSNYPNPFKAQTNIAYYLSEAADNIILDVYDILGQKVYSNNLGPQPIGKHDFVFNTVLQPGVYFYSLQTNNFRQTQKMLIND